MGGCSRASAFRLLSHGATPRQSAGSTGPRLLKAQSAKDEGARSLCAAQASIGAVTRSRGRPDRTASQANLPLSPPCRHSLAGHGAIRLRFGRKVEVSVCVTGVSGVDLLLSMEHSMHAA